MATEPVPVKDKRTLVLFLFGALMLVSDLIGTDKPPLTHTYTVAAGEGGTGWQLVRDAAGPPDIVAQSDHPGRFLEEEKKQLIKNLNGISQVPCELYLFAGQQLPINRANAHALQLLPGVGPRLAQAIITDRQHNGNFTAPADLDRVKGIGPTKLQQLLPLVSFQ